MTVRAREPIWIAYLTRSEAGRSAAYRPQPQISAPAIAFPSMRDADRGVLAFAAAHHLILAEHVASLLGSNADAARERLARLQLAGLIRRTRMLAIRPGGYQITSAGLAAIASELPPPRLDPGRYWLWLAATKGGNFGPIDQVLTEREMRARDTQRDPAELNAQPPDPTTDPTEPIGLCFGVHPGGD